MGTEKMSFGAYLRNLRRQKRLSQKELADMVDMDHTYLSKIETEVLPPPSEKNIKKLAQILEVSEDELLVLAHKTPSDLRDVITKDKNIPSILRRAKNLSPSDWKEVEELINKLRKEEDK
jgi:transcriptional regulator with XRE-family HTH domain